MGPRLGSLSDVASLDRVRRIAATFPGASFGHVGFERRLRCPGAGVDFSLSLTSAGLRHVRESATWPRIAPLFDLCSSMLPVDDGLWLEFDTSTGPSEVAEPNFFLPIERTGSEPLVAPSVVDRLLEALRDAAYEVDRDRLQFVIARWSEALPPSVNRGFIGFMLARTPFEIRLCAMPMSGRDALSVLRAIHWRGDTGWFAETTSSFEGVTDFLCLHVDPANPTEGSVGLELLYAAPLRAMQPSVEPRWQSLFELLERHGACFASERSHLLEWEHQTGFELPLFDQLVARVADRGNLVLHGMLLSALHHVKIILSPDRAICAKAYFGAVFESPTS